MWHFLMNNQAIAWIASLILMFVGGGLAKYAKDLRKDLKIAQTVIVLVNDTLDALDDNKITPEEVQKLKDDICAIKGDCK